jgi:hypothetical protein
MTPEQIDAIVNIVELGIAEAIQAHILQKVPHGYCFYCDTEMEVYDVAPSEEIPAQPPICHECIIGIAVEMFRRYET